MKNKQDNQEGSKNQHSTYQKNPFYPSQRVGFEGIGGDAALIVMSGELKLDDA
jgi:hypothetical protein